MDILNDEQVAAVAGGMDGLGPYTPEPGFEYECPNLERWKREREINPL